MLFILVKDTKPVFHANLFDCLLRSLKVVMFWNFRRGHVEFIYAALSRMKDFETNRDLDTYKKLLEVFPKGKMIPTNVWQVEMMHYPKQQQCCIDVLDQMEANGLHLLNSTHYE